MMNKKDLNQYQFIKKEIELIKEQIKDFDLYTFGNIVTDSVKGSAKDFPYTVHSIKIVGSDYSESVNRLSRLKDRLQKKVKELDYRVLEVNRFIAKIEDAEVRFIFRLRYIDGLSWQEIAEKKNYEGDGSTERKKHDRYLKTAKLS